MRLYLLRHGIAEQAKVGGSDEDRALTSEGRRKLRRVLKLARKAEVCPELILSSPLKRAYETAQLAKEILGNEEKIITTEVLGPSSSPEDVWQEVRAHREIESLLLVGHNPLFATLAAYLMAQPAAPLEFKKGAMMRFDFQKLSAQPAGVLRWCLTPDAKKPPK
jgi:phosphohistidine phosphatase